MDGEEITVDDTGVTPLRSVEKPYVPPATTSLYRITLTSGTVIGVALTDDESQALDNAVANRTPFRLMPLRDVASGPVRDGRVYFNGADVESFAPKLDTSG